MPQSLQSRLRHFLRTESGATAIEYGLFAALIGAALIAGLTTMDAKGLFKDMRKAVAAGLR